MNSLALIVMFYNLAKQYAKSYADKLLGRVATGFNWLGAVKYHSDLPASANEGRRVHSYVHWFKRHSR